VIWVLSIAISVAGAAAWAGMTRLASIWAERSGKLTGDWYQVTYWPEDIEMTDEPWSIEWVEARHRRSSVRGRMWRVYRRALRESQAGVGAAAPIQKRPGQSVIDPQNRWVFVGRCVDSPLNATYWADRGAGGQGSMHMWKVNNTHYRGKFAEVKLEGSGLLMKIKIEEAGIEWIRVDSPEARRVLGYCDDLDERELAEWLPRGIRAKLHANRAAGPTGGSSESASERVV